MQLEAVYLEAVLYVYLQSRDYLSLKFHKHGYFIEWAKFLLLQSTKSSREGRWAIIKMISS